MSVAYCFRSRAEEKKKKEIQTSVHPLRWRFGQKSFSFPVLREPVSFQVKSSENILFEPSITKWWNLRSATETSQTGINTEHLTY